jgi:hypothetical protein
VICLRAEAEDIFVFGGGTYGGGVAGLQFLRSSLRYIKIRHEKSPALFFFFFE